MGRLRHKPWADEYLKNSNKVISDFRNVKGNWNNNIFKNNNKIFLEIGHGKGQFIINNALKNNDINFIGLEKFASVQVIPVKRTEELDIKNLVFISTDANEIEDIFSKGEIEKIFINFPDPWPKDRHNKRRLLYKGFLEKYHNILSKEGIIEFRTDQEKLFEFALEEINEFKKFEIVEISRNLHKEKNVEFKTEYEEKFSNNGDSIYFIKLKII